MSLCVGVFVFFVLVQYMRVHFSYVCMCWCVSGRKIHSSVFISIRSHLSRQLHNNNEGKFSLTEWVPSLF